MGGYLAINAAVFSNVMPLNEGVLPRNRVKAGFVGEGVIVSILVESTS